jgi:hypothetical protein
VLPALDNPSRMVPREADNPTKNAADTITKRDNIVALMKELNIVDRWQATRQPILKLKDQISVAILGLRPEEEHRLDLVGLLEKRLLVATDESSITVSIEWPDRQMAFDIMSLVQKNFLEARYDSNVSVIEDAIRILDERAKPESREVDVALAELSKLDADRKRPHPIEPGAAAVTPAAQRPAVPPSAPAAPGASAPNDSALRLEDVRRRIRTLEEDSRRRIADTQSQLVDARTTLGPLHPTVVALNEKLTQVSAPPPELASLRVLERDLVAQVAKGPDAPPQAAGSAQAPPATALPRIPGADVVSTPGSAPRDSVERLLDLRDDPPTALARSKLQAASAKYNELLSRIEAANIELEVTRASFKYQYTIVKPPELARKPSKPNVALVMIAAFLLALVLMLLVPAGLDLWRGRFVEAWQVERQLNLPLLGELLTERE